MSRGLRPQRWSGVGLRFEGQFAESAFVVHRRWSGAAWLSLCVQRERAAALASEYFAVQSPLGLYLRLAWDRYESLWQSLYLAVWGAPCTVHRM